MIMYKFDDELKIVQGFKDCKKCIHFAVCVFHDKMRELAESVFMYKMTEQFIQNSVLKVFEEYASCKYYTEKYPMLEIGESINLNCDPEIINYIIYNDIKLIEKNVLERIKNSNDKINIDEKHFFFNSDVKIDIDKNYYHLILRTTNTKIGYGAIVFESDIFISEILKEWKFGEVK